MFRTTSLILGLALLGTAAHAADTVDYKVSLQGKTPYQVHAAIVSAATEACKEALFAASPLPQPTLQDIEACTRDAVQSAQAQADALLTADASR